MRTNQNKKTRAILSEKGYKVTPQRLAILELVRAKGHFDADELYRRARKKYPRISLSTIYRTLLLFRQMGLVDGHSFAQSHCHYESLASGEHYHLLCSQCGRIVEFAHPLIEKIKKEVSREHGFVIKQADIHLTGLCHECQRKRM
jgi:Fe2+ or Zn2+ uptake regulation protein